MLSIYLDPLCLAFNLSSISHIIKSRPKKVNTTKGNNLSGDSLAKAL